MKNKSYNISTPSSGQQTNTGYSLPMKANKTDVNAIRAYSNHVKSEAYHFNNTGEKNAVTGLRQLFATQMKDLYAAEKAITGALPTMIKKASSRELTDTLKQHLHITQDQLERCESVFNALRLPNESSTPETVRGLMNETRYLIKITSPGSVRDAGIISLAQKVKHYEIASYGTLAAFARQLGETKVASFLEESLAEQKVADMILSEVAERYVNRSAIVEAF